MSEISQKPQTRYNEADARYRIIQRNAKRQKEEHDQNMKAGGPRPPKVKEEPIPWVLIMFIFGAFILVMALSAGLLFGIIWYFDLWHAMD